jgi:hypothetical protein
MFNASHARALDHFVAGNYAASIDWLDNARALCFDDHERATIDDLRAYVMIRAGLFEQADKALDLAITGFELADDVMSMSNSLVSRGEIALRGDQPEQALECFERAILGYQSVGAPTAAMLTERLRRDAHVQVATSFVSWSDPAF